LQVLQNSNESAKGMVEKIKAVCISEIQKVGIYPVFKATLLFSMQCAFFDVFIFYGFID